MIANTDKPYTESYYRSTALVARPSTIYVARPTNHAPFVLSRMARVLIVGALALLLSLSGYGLGALLLLCFWGIVGAATRKGDTSARIYGGRVGPFLVRLRGDAETDAWYDGRMK